MIGAPERATKKAMDGTGINFANLAAGYAKQSGRDDGTHLPFCTFVPTLRTLSLTRHYTQELWLQYLDAADPEQRPDDPTTADYYCLGEIIPRVAPVVVRATIPWVEDRPDAFIACLVAAFQQALLANFAIGRGRAELTAATLISSDGLHPVDKSSCVVIEVRFPYALVPLAAQGQLLKPAAIRFLQQQKAQQYLAEETKGGYEAILQTLDERGKYLPLVGSVEAPDAAPLQLEDHGYEAIDAKDFQNAPRVPLSRLLRNAKEHSYFRTGILADGSYDGERSGSPYYWALQLSLHFATVPLEVRRVESKTDAPDLTPDLEPGSELDLAVRYMNMIIAARSQHPELQRRDDVESILSVIIGTFHNLTSGSSVGLEQVRRFVRSMMVGAVLQGTPEGKEEGREASGLGLEPVSERKRAPWLTRRHMDMGPDPGVPEDQPPRKYCPAYSLEQWLDIAESRYEAPTAESLHTGRDLHWLAKRFNPAEEAEHFREHFHQHHLKDLLKGTDWGIAQAFHAMAKDIFVNTNGANTGWRMFEGHIWKRVNNGAAVVRYLTGPFRDYCNELIEHYAIVSRKSDDERTRAESSEHIMFLNKVVLKLEKSKKTIISEACAIFEKGNSEFEKHLDANVYLTARANGVHEILQVERLGDEPRRHLPGRHIFREGRPEDYCSMASRALHHYRWSHPSVVALMKYMRQVFPDRELRTVYLRSQASTYVGRNVEKKLTIYTGEGDNSKSIIVKIEKKAFDGHFVDAPVALFTEKKKSSSAASPELAQAAGKRALYAAESDPSDALRADAVKRDTGNDGGFQRKLYDNGGSQETTHKSKLICNVPPMFSDTDRAGMKRLTFIPFMVTWSKDAPISLEEQRRQQHYPPDPDFERKIPELANALAWVSAQYFDDYAQNGLGESTLVNKRIEDYWKDNNPYQQFYNETIEMATTVGEDGEVLVDEKNRPIQDTSVYLTQADVTKTFQDWYRTAKERRPPSLTLIHAQLNDIMRARPAGGRWYGVRYKPNVGVAQFADGLGG